eukprot:Opistho-2@54882
MKDTERSLLARREGIKHTLDERDGETQEGAELGTARVGWNHLDLSADCSIGKVGRGDKRIHVACKKSLVLLLVQEPRLIRIEGDIWRNALRNGHGVLVLRVAVAVNRSSAKPCVRYIRNRNIAAESFDDHEMRLVIINSVHDSVIVVLAFIGGNSVARVHDCIKLDHLCWREQLTAKVTIGLLNRIDDDCNVLGEKFGLLSRVNAKIHIRRNGRVQTVCGRIPRKNDGLIRTLSGLSHNIVHTCRVFVTKALSREHGQNFLRDVIERVRRNTVEKRIAVKTGQKGVECTLVFNKFQRPLPLRCVFVVERHTTREATGIQFVRIPRRQVEYLVHVNDSSIWCLTILVRCGECERKDGLVAFGCFVVNDVDR